MADMAPRGHRASRQQPDSLAAPDRPIAQVLDRATASASKIVLGKEHQIRLALACIITGGHLLIEDTPGVGKTTLARTLAQVLGLSFQRIQFTSDLLPADIIGASVYNRATSEFEFRAGPLFAQLLLADEINRATPKTQSALLESMAEGQATVDGTTRALAQPFLVIATQNPRTQIGTFPLPESQLDRFSMCIAIGYPNAAAERALLSGDNPYRHIGDIKPIVGARRILALQQHVREVHLAPAVIDYIQQIIRFTRVKGRFVSGLSPRAALHLKSAAQAWALMAGHRAVLPEDIQAVLAGVVNHRLVPHAGLSDTRAQQPAEVILESVAIP